MKFSSCTLVLAFGISTCAYVSGFAPQPSFTRAVIKNVEASTTLAFHEAGCDCLGCTQALNRNSLDGSCSVACKCPSCASTRLMMAEDTETEAPAAESAAEEAEEAEVPAEVAALDGVLSDEEAHNMERPARGSGLHKHKNKRAPGKPLTELEVGASLEAKVKTIASYGAFVDVGYESDALLHVSRLSDDFVSNVEDVVKQGDTVTVRVVSVDLEKKQIAVTMRSEEAEAKASAPRGAPGGGKRRERPQRSGADREAQRALLSSLGDKGFDGDKFIEGEVVNTLAFGAFVRFDTSQLGEFEGELDGLVHISALSSDRVDTVESVAKVGDKVQVRVRDVDTDGNRVSLSMISKEAEQKQRGNRGGGDGERRRRPQQRWTEEEMGAKDWKDSLDKFLETQTSFTNAPVVVNRK